MTMTNDAERAEYFRAFAGRVIDVASQSMKLGVQSRRKDNESAAIAGEIEPWQINPLGDDVPKEDMAEIEALFADEPAVFDPYKEAQIRELAFWRYVAIEGYLDDDPRAFPLHQELHMVATFYRSGWSLSDFVGATVLELGCGPLGMIEYIPAKKRVAFDPLNARYSQLFSRYRSSAIDYISAREDLTALRPRFDLAICHNVIDHTENPAFWFNALFAKLRNGGRFLFQVNLSSPDVDQPEEHRRMHPSPFVKAQIMDWLGAKSDDFEFETATQASIDGEFHFLAWGRKTKDDAVQYENLMTWPDR